MKVAAVQFAPEFMDAKQNTQTAIEVLHRLAAEGVDFAVLPEAFLTGYCFESKDEALHAAIPVDGREFELLASACSQDKISAIIGFAERAGEHLYNSAAVITPTGLAGVYRKTHLPFLGLDRFAEAGESLPLFDVGGAKVAVGICYDVRVPELSRCYALNGADIICIPTNWPESAEKSSDIMCPARAMENHVFIIAADRVGEERGYRFIGRSKIIDPLGNVIAAADHNEEAIVLAEIDPEAARDKNVVKRAGEYELPIFESRNPALYSRIADK
jgi:predicted amidohydrolase